uniref:Solute carrier family 22 member 16 n=1 Tax=Oryctolagus cuniculus TaxID=9986 RepID=A0A5F9D6J0_RABIT|nr:solute carrier family 22 member 16 isoform X1 [Oryctolagus cuniculus]
MKYPGVELIFDHVGHFGRFQVFIYFICAFQNMSCGIHYMGSMILVVAPEHACKPPGNVSKFVVHNTSVAKLEDVWALMSPDHKEHITAELQNGEVWDLSRCGRVRRDSPLHAANSGSEPHFPCSDGYVYDQRQWKSTVVTKWNLICDQKLFAKLIQPIFMFGVLLGAIIFGYFSDKKGRQVVLWFTSTGIFLFGILSTFTFDYYIFMIARFFLAMVTSGYLVVGFVYVTEFVGRKSRTWTSMNMNSFFVFGLIVVAFTGYFVKTWWLYQVILSSVTFPFILYCWVLPESPFWLISEGRYKEAQQLIDVMAHWNGTSRCDLCEVLSLDLSAPVGSKSAATKKPNILDLFYSWKVTSGTLTIWLVWFTVSFGFYSLSMKPIHSGDSVYINLFLVAVLEIPGYIFTSVLINKVGRRIGQAFCLFCIALFCTIIIAIPQRYYFGVIAATIFARFFIGSTFGLVYLYTAELYPTVVRSLAMGTSNMVCRVGSILAPVALYLSSTWIFMPQLSLGILSFLGGVFSMTLPETNRKPLATTWEEMALLESEHQSTSSKAVPTANEPGVENTEVVKLEDSGLGE